MSRFAANTTLFLALVQAAVALAIAFGWDITEDQVAAILAFTSAAFAVLAIYFHPKIPVGSTEPPA